MANGQQADIRFKGISVGIGEDSLPPGIYQDFRNIDMYVFNVARQRSGYVRVIHTEDFTTSINPPITIAAFKPNGALSYLLIDRGGAMYKLDNISRDS